MSENKIVFRCLEVRQPIGTFYVGAIDASDLVAISYADIRRLEKRDIEKYLGIQRTLNDSRVSEITQYVRTVDATFPTAVILAISSEHVEYSADKCAMSLTRQDDVAKIVDGQHRIAGLKGYVGPNFMVNAAIFVDMDIEDQANVFATINLSQTKVSKSLAYDLFEYAKHRSPQKTAHNAARVLNRENGSPFKDKIKVLGTATPGKLGETLTQAAFVDALLPLLTNDRLADRDKIQRGQKLERPDDSRDDPRILRNLFIEERDADIVLIIWNYFEAVQRRWPFAWNEKETGNILNRTTGFSALMKFLPIAYRASRTRDSVVATEFFSTIFSAVSLSDSDFTPSHYSPGSSGSSALLRDLVSATESVRLRA